MSESVKYTPSLSFDRRILIEAFAAEVAEYQRKADVAYYIRHDQDHSSFLLDCAWAIKNLAIKLGICGEVYQRAYEYYDFRNSGKSGYTLKDGKIVKESDDEVAS